MAEALPAIGLADREIVAAFRLALLAGDQLRLVYQPRIELATGSCHAAEALLRWEHPVHGDVPPARFVQLIEATPLIGRLTDWVLDTAMGFAATLNHAGHRIRVGTNISPANLSVGYLVGRLVELLRQHELPPNALQFEITEGALIGDDHRTRAQLAQLRRIGIGVAIDDFGAGYSNLGYLRQIPADTIKIDRSLIAPIADDRASGVIVKWLIGLAHELGLTVVAEGLETPAQLALLTEWGCDEVQGYLVSRPLAQAALPRWLADR